MKKASNLILAILLLTALAGCSGSQALAAPSAESTTVQADPLQAATAPTAVLEDAMTADELEAAGAGAASAEEAMVENSKTHEDLASWDASDVVPVQLKGDSISADGRAAGGERAY